jgi:amino acid adenylation domain-containing protein
MSVHSIFAYHARSRPDAVAFETYSRKYTYGEVLHLSARAARRITAAGVKPGDFAAVLGDRSPEIVIAWLAVLRCGAAYLPLDPAYPDCTLAFMLADSAPKIVLRGRGVKPGLAALDGVRTIDLDNLFEADPGGEWMDAAAGPETPAYIMYTSGSTGQPKGVVVPHRGVVRLVRDQNYMPFTTDEVYLQISPLTFDAATWEVWGALLNGARLAVQQQPRFSLADIGAGIRDFDVTSVFLTSALFNVFVEQSPEMLKGLSRVLVGGDAMSPEHARRFMSACPGCELINGYGPTETTTFSVCHRLDPAQWAEGSVPIGVPLNHDSAYILDDAMQPVPPGDTGMLWIGGDGVALGYHDRPELTAERFRPDPFANDGSLMYFSGDLARMRPDGLIECLGRVDRQVKVDGKRIELDEIEHAFRRDARLADAAVVLDAEAVHRKRIVAFLKAAGKGGDDLRDAVLADYRARMPEYMVPHIVHIVDEFPLNRNGKVDRKALLAAAHKPAAEPRAYGSEMEQIIAQAWGQALGHSDFTLTQNFFDCGGASLAMLRVHALLEESLNRTIPITELFARPTIASLAAALTAKDQVTPATAIESRTAKQKLAFARARLRKA